MNTREDRESAPGVPSPAEGGVDAAERADGSDGSGGTDGLARRLGELARSLHDESDLDTRLVDVVQTALQLIPEASDASISLVKGRRRVEPRAASGALPGVIDDIQSEIGQGPCLDAAFRQRLVRVADMGRDSRWPIFARRAWDAGARSMLCFQLFVEGDTMGALNLYAGVAGAFGQEAEQTGALVATHAAIALSDAKEVRGLNDALVNRDLIGQAKGILMERYKISSHQAFVLLSSASSSTNTRLTDVAASFVHTGDLATKRPPRG
ncbi:GAF and ANTAR domain-containing protein [Arthrobacter sp. B0490]|uniref:GAF and ANTAR domain-containing protein n=1 Tax=Arthrobacter sp. B0490 TaxID=2058891 RepID=UPI000CE47E07|nr:GAF and ANTAR domain-containing protein [Arthrobacter sp. B0490]